MNHSKTDYEIIQKDFYRDGKRIDGQLYLPNLPWCPLVIICHGFGGSRRRGIPYAQGFAENGIAAYIFEFIGGGEDIRSDGKMTEMSVLTEARDLEIILDGLKKLPEIDRNNIFLMGRSQGGYVATLVGAERKDEIKGLLLHYPAYVIQDDVIERTGNGERFEPLSSFLGHTVSDIYDRDAYSVDIYARMRRFTGTVLILHGSDDQTVPISYSYEAVETFPHADLVTIEGAGHGFENNDDLKARELSLNFIKENCS